MHESLAPWLHYISVYLLSFSGWTSGALKWTSRTVQSWSLLVECSFRRMSTDRRTSSEILSELLFYLMCFMWMLLLSFCRFFPLLCQFQAIFNQNMQWLLHILQCIVDLTSCTKRAHVNTCSKVIITLSFYSCPKIGS